jgi:glycosyltransferase involved in cell wall biosynthesis
MTWFTGTPVPYEGGSAFFLRDSGLVCKGLQSIGLSCKSIMPLPAHPGDITEDLIRTDAENLARPEWWSSIGASKVVLYSWAHYKYRRIAEATRESGAKVLVNLDGGGIMSPKVTPVPYFHAVIGRQIHQHGPLIGTLTGVLRSIAYRFYIPLVQEPGRIAHLRAATVIGCISPAGLTLWRLWARTYAPELAERMHVVPNPVVEYLKYDPAVAKQDMVIAIGRWNDEQQKRPVLLAAAIAETAKRRSTTEFHIYGNSGRLLPAWHANLPTAVRRRVHLHGKVAHTDMLETFMGSRIGLCSSSHEGSHVASEEALCAGASVVAPFRKELNALLWYVSHDSGRLSVEDSAQGLAETLLLELDAWDRGDRDPVSISRYWCSQLSASAVANRIRDLLD